MSLPWFPAQDLTEHFRSVSNDPPVSGMALVKGINPHFDVLAAAETPLAAALANSFPIEGGDVEAFTDLLRQEEGRVETTQAQLEEMYPEECARAREGTLMHGKSESLTV